MGQLDEQRHKEGWDMTVEIGGIAALVRLGFTDNQIHSFFEHK